MSDVILVHTASENNIMTNIGCMKDTCHVSTSQSTSSGTLLVCAGQEA